MATIFMTPGDDYDANELESERQDIQDELDAEWEAEQARLREESDRLLAEELQRQADEDHTAFLDFCDMLEEHDMTPRDFEELHEL